jgi:uncharacterized membrane protein
LALAVVAFAPLQAQTLRPEIVTGTLLGGAAGAVIGHNSGDLRNNGWRGAAIGAGAGLLLGSLAAQANDRHYSTQVPVPDAPRTYVYREAPVYYRAPGRWAHPGSAYHGYGGYYQRPVYYGNAGYYGDVAYEDGSSERGDYRANGLLLGALAGGVIGHNSGDLRHNGWRGAAIGAGLGYLLGSVAEHNARQREAREAQTPVTQTAPANAAPAAPATDAPAVTAPVATPSSGSSMSAANSLCGRK